MLSKNFKNKSLTLLSIVLLMIEELKLEPCSMLILHRGRKENWL
jgi:hypothetical protein